MSYSEEFETIDLIRASCAETRGVDAFALSLIKAERQLRRLFTFLVYQFPCFGEADIPALRDTLGRHRVYFDGVERGLNALSQHSAEDLIGQEYRRLKPRIEEATEYRNKIFHGQLTQKYLSRDELFDFVADIRQWCETLAAASTLKVGYDGFARDSFRKGPIPDLWKNFRVHFTDVASYDIFIQQHMRRR